MSWDGYLTSLKSPNSNGVVSISEAAIWGKKDGQRAPWAVTEGLANVTVDEVNVLLGDRSKFDTQGPYVGGVKCMKVRDEFDYEGVYTISFNTKGTEQNPSVPLYVGQTREAIIIVKGIKGISGGTVKNKLYETIEYLRKANL